MTTAPAAWFEVLAVGAHAQTNREDASHVVGKHA
jgi:hypothetical protein